MIPAAGPPTECGGPAPGAGPDTEHQWHGAHELVWEGGLFLRVPVFFLLRARVFPGDGEVNWIPLGPTVAVA